MGSRGASSKAGGGGPAPVPAPVPQPTPTPTPTPPALRPKDNTPVNTQDLENFRDAFNKLDDGKLFLTMTELRDELSQYSRSKFDNIIRTLYNQGRIDLHPADRSRMTEKEWEDTFFEHNVGYHMRRVTRHDSGWWTTHKNAPWAQRLR